MIQMSGKNRIPYKQWGEWWMGENKMEINKNITEKENKIKNSSNYKESKCCKLCFYFKEKDYGKGDCYGLDQYYIFEEYKNIKELVRVDKYHVCNNFLRKKQVNPFKCI